MSSLGELGNYLILLKEPEIGECRGVGLLAVCWLVGVFSQSSW